MYQRHQQLHDLRLGGNIQGRGGLVRHDQLRVAGNGDRNHYALPHTAGHLKRVVLHTRGRIGDANGGQGLNALLPSFLFRHFAVCAQHFCQLVADRIDRVQAGHRLLEDHGNAVAAHIAHLLGRIGEQIFSVEPNLAAKNLAGRGLDQLHDGQLRHRLAGAGLANHSDDLVLIDMETYIVDGFDLTSIGKKGGAKIFYIQQNFLFHYSFPLSLGSSASRSASPTMLNAITTSIMQMPGRMAISGWLNRYL